MTLASSIISIAGRASLALYRIPDPAPDYAGRRTEQYDAGKETDESP
ncbi:hypothetical protein [Nitrobacter sp. 62-13]|jgi:hypothetical protein|nr:hypothetical protein [Nitrobacter sp. 62-13]